MKILTLLFGTFCLLNVHAQNMNTMYKTEMSSFINFDDYEKLIPIVKEHRKERLIDLDRFLIMSKEPNTIILDTRSDGMFDLKHILGAIHLNFSDFTEANLHKLIPSDSTRILIYCNNNFKDDSLHFATKMTLFSKKPLTLALNIPTYINLYGYGYRNVFELSEKVSVSDKRIEFEGTSVNR